MQLDYSRQRSQEIDFKTALKHLWQGGASWAPALHEGTILIYDSRTLHRGLANQSERLARPVLVFRYDDVR